MDRQNLNSFISPDDEILTLQEATKLQECNLTAGSLRTAINRRKLRARKFGNTWCISKKELLEYLARRKPGRPPKPRLTK